MSYSPRLKDKYTNEIVPVLTEKFKSTNFSYTGNLSRGIEETISLLKNANQLK